MEIYEKAKELGLECIKTPHHDGYLTWVILLKDGDRPEFTAQTQLEVAVFLLGYERAIANEGLW